MKRKIFKLGKSTLVVSLPAKWIKKYNISKGDELNIEEKERSISFSTEKETSQTEVEINLTNLNKDLIRWYLIGAYVRGYDQIKIIFEKQENMFFAQEVINSLIGLAIIEQGNSYCIAGEVSGTTDRQFDNIFRRIFLLIISIAEDSFAALEKSDNESLKGIERRDLDVDKFINFCLRILNKRGYKEYAKTPVIYNFLQELGELGDNYTSLSDDLLDVDLSKMRKELKTVYDETNKLIRIFYELFYDFEKEKILEFYNKRKSIIKTMAELKNIRPNEITILYHLRKINENVLELFKLKVAGHF